MKKTRLQYGGYSMTEERGWSEKKWENRERVVDFYSNAL